MDEIVEDALWRKRRREWSIEKRMAGMIQDIIRMGERYGIDVFAGDPSLDESESKPILWSPVLLSEKKDALQEAIKKTGAPPDLEIHIRDGVGAEDIFGRQ